MIFLYDGHGAPRQHPENSHAGLWFERFFDRYNKDGTISKEDEDKKNPRQCWLMKNFSGTTVGDKKALTNHCLRQWCLVEALQGTWACFQSDWHFVTGMGNPHPAENGFSWHPVLGVPYLIGAAVKGLLRAYLETWEGWKEQENSELRQWFGDTEQAGGLIFFDAVPVRPVSLGVDIMTPHMGKWYENGGAITKESYPDTLPADWHDPTPIPFLTATDIKLIFSVAHRPRAPEKIDLDEVVSHLQKALECLGAGAKTAVGYGRMYESEI